MATQKGNIKYYQKELKKGKVEKKNKQQLHKDLKENQTLARENQTLIKALETKDWQRAYAILIKQEKFWLNDAKRNNGSDYSLALLKRDLCQLQLLAKQHLAMENEHFPIQGGFFVLFMMQEVLPPLTILAAIFILTKLYSAGYYERMRLGNLLPQKQLVFTEFTTGLMITFAYFLLIFLLVFLLPSIFFGTGNLNYPITGMNPGAKEYTFTPMYQLFLPILGIAFLSFAFITGAVLLIVQLLKNRLLALFAAVLLLGGGMVLPQYVVAVRNLAQFLPMSYFFALQPVDGMFGISNAYVFTDESQLVTYPQVNFSNGLIVLIIGTAVLLFLNQLLAKRIQAGRKIK
ncbi:hypothetical protein KIM322_03790 [Lactobacillus xylocopicola]|uniref:ABC transporter permease n=1 Tax=Lactobacillus xylocopicola TaxID=2976676 RepID=A0ABN6SKH0_9LACO|nr:hypothetical protein KIM322_03790 [Lactobacillus xylocopicola]